MLQNQLDGNFACFRKKELEKKEKEHSTEFNTLVESLKKEKEKLLKEHAKQAKVHKR